jgi:ankyrin repeat protein
MRRFVSIVAVILLGTLTGCKQRQLDDQLVAAVANSDVSAGSNALLDGANPNMRMRNALRQTPLHYAALLNDAAMIELLLKNGADPQMLDKEGHSAIHYALTSPFIQVTPESREEAAEILQRLKKSGLLPTPQEREIAKALTPEDPRRAMILAD